MDFNYTVSTATAYIVSSTSPMLELDSSGDFKLACLFGMVGIILGFVTCYIIFWYDRQK